MITRSFIQMRQNPQVVMCYTWGAAITWILATQTIIARLIIELEFVDLQMAKSEIEWFRNFLANISSRMKPSPYVSIYCDYRTLITITKSKTYNGKNKHI